MKNALSIQRKVVEESKFDSLTKLLNRKTFYQIPGDLIKTNDAKGSSLSLLFLDIDNLKKFNDTFGHLVGDQVLEAVSGEIRKNIRSMDIAGRFGGDEVVILFEGLTEEQTENRAELIRKAVADHEFLIRGKSEIVQITVSIGISYFLTEWKGLPTEESINKFVQVADEALC